MQFYVCPDLSFVPHLIMKKILGIQSGPFSSSYKKAKFNETVSFGSYIIKDLEFVGVLILPNQGEVGEPAALACSTTSHAETWSALQ